MDVWQIVAGLVGGALVCWSILVAVMAVAAHRRAEHLTIVAALRLVPDVVRLIARIAADRSVPWWVRGLVALLGLYLLSPIDLVPDFVPVIGYLDDVLVVVVIMRLAIARAGPAAVTRNWPGTAEGLRALASFTGTALR